MTKLRHTKKNGAKGGVSETKKASGSYQKQLSAIAGVNGQKSEYQQ